MNNSKWIYMSTIDIYLYGAGCWKAPEDFYRFMTSRIEGHVLTNVLQVVMSIRGRFLFFCSGVNTHAIVFVGIGANTQNYIDGTEK